MWHCWDLVVVVKVIKVLYQCQTTAAVVRRLGVGVVWMGMQDGWHGCEGDCG